MRREVCSTRGNAAEREGRPQQAAAGSKMQPGRVYRMKSKVISLSDSSWSVPQSSDTLTCSEGCLLSSASGISKA